MQERLFNHTGFQAYLAEQRLMGSRCAECGQLCLPPRPLCPRCFSTNMEWSALSGAGRLAGVTTIYIGLPDMAAEGFSRERPYHSGVVQLDEGPSISAQILLPPGGEMKNLQVGMPVQAVFIEHSSGEARQVVLAFAPAAGRV